MEDYKRSDTEQRKFRDKEKQRKVAFRTKSFSG
jgi:hypothetical protein